MGHSDDPKDAAGGARRCGGNLLVSTATAKKQESALSRNLRAASEIISSLRSAVALRKSM